MSQQSDFELQRSQKNFALFYRVSITHNKRMIIKNDSIIRAIESNQR